MCLFCYIIEDFFFICEIITYCKIVPIVVVPNTALDMLLDEKADERGKPILSLMTCYYTSKNGTRFFALGELAKRYPAESFNKIAICYNKYHYSLNNFKPMLLKSYPNFFHGYTFHTSSLWNSHETASSF